MPVGFRFINMKRSYVILIFLFVNCIICNSQVNLVLNPSFEILDSCPNSGLQINRATNWNNINNTWPCQGQLAHHCCVDPQCTTPSNQNGGGTTYQFQEQEMDTAHYLYIRHQFQLFLIISVYILLVNYLLHL